MTTTEITTPEATEVVEPATVKAARTRRARKSTAKAAAPAKLALQVWGPNLRTKDGATFHVHSAGCPDTTKGIYRKAKTAGDQGGWEIEATDVAEVVEAIYSDIIAENPGTTWADYADDVRIFPCSTLAPEVVEAPAKATKSVAKKAVVKPRDTSIKTWTQTAVEVRAAVAELKGLVDPAGLKFVIVTRETPVYATTKAQALAAKTGSGVETFSVELGTNVPEVRGHGYVATIQGVRRGGEIVTTATVWLSPAGPVVLTLDGKKVTK